MIYYFILAQAATQALQETHTGTSYGETQLCCCCFEIPAGLAMEVTRRGLARIHQAKVAPVIFKSMLAQKAGLNKNWGENWF